MSTDTNILIMSIVLGFLLVCVGEHEKLTLKYKYKQNRCKRTKTSVKNEKVKLLELTDRKTYKVSDGQYRVDLVRNDTPVKQKIQEQTHRYMYSDHELLIAKFRLKLKKVGKITRPYSYDLNQIPYDYTVEVRNRFKGLDLIDRVPDELWMEVRGIVQETGIKTIPMEKKCKKSKMAVWGGLTNSCEKKRSEEQRRKGKI